MDDDRPEGGCASRRNQVGAADEDGKMSGGGQPEVVEGSLEDDQQAKALSALEMGRESDIDGAAAILHDPVDRHLQFPTTVFSKDI